MHTVAALVITGHTPAKGVLVQLSKKFMFSSSTFLGINIFERYTNISYPAKLEGMISKIVRVSSVNKEGGQLWIASVYLLIIS